MSARPGQHVPSLLLAIVLGAGCTATPGPEGGPLDAATHEVKVVLVAQCETDSDCGENTSPCVRQVCSAKGFCQVEYNVAAQCDDGDLCTAVDLCQPDGTCAGGGELICDDLNECTEDSCSSESGCVFISLADGSPCEDGNLCTEDACLAGECLSSAPKDCPDLVSHQYVLRGQASASHLNWRARGPPARMATHVRLEINVMAPGCVSRGQTRNARRKSPA